MSRQTKELISLIERRASEYGSSNEAQQLINQGADIGATVKNHSMIDCVIGEMNRHQQVAATQKAQNCYRLFEVLQNHASYRLANSVLSEKGCDVKEIAMLRRLYAKCYQSERFGQLGLVGELLKQEKASIQLDAIQFLIEHDEEAKLGLMAMDAQEQTCLSLSKKNPKCPPEVRQFIQNTLDMTLNQIPLANPQVNVNEVAEWIHRGANPEFVDGKGNTVLCNAVLANNQKLVEKLVSIGCNTAHTNKNQLTPLQIAQNASERNGQLETILKGQNTNTELKQLIETRRHLLTFDEVNALLEKGAKIDVPIANQSTLLHLLIANEGSPEMVAAFINDFHANIAAMDSRGHRPIETCILFDKRPFNVLQIYLQLPKVSSDTYFNTKLNKSILQFAREENRPEAASIIQNSLNLRLWNLIAQANTKEEHNQTLTPELHHLVVCGAEINHIYTEKDYDKWTVLHLACKTSTESLVKFLIEYEKADYNIRNGNGDSPLAIAAEYGRLSVVRYLHSTANVDLNVPNKDKQTPLHLATQNHHLLIVRYLVRWGADHQVKNAAKDTPLDLARKNPSKTKEDEANNKSIVHFLEQLICPKIESADQQSNEFKKPKDDLDTCELVIPVAVPAIQVTSLGDEEELGVQSRGIFSNNANENLLHAAREGLIDIARTAIGNGANICYRKNGRNAYEIAQQSIAEYHRQSIANQSRPQESREYQMRMMACQQICNLIRETAYARLRQAIEKSHAYRVVAYKEAGAPLSGDLLKFTCSISDNVQIVDYLIRQSDDAFQAMFECSADDSPYRIAKQNKFNNVASYLKYRLSEICTRAIKDNNTEVVRKLVRAGASVDMHDTENLRVALALKNATLVEVICENGVKMPSEWCQSPTITLPEQVAQTIDPQIVLSINRSLINRRLRLAAAKGDLQTLHQCQHLGANINSENCYGSTAVLCSIQHGNYFSIVHALVSRGATILHSNDDEPMSTIALAKERKYIQISKYLSNELNSQFLVAIMNNDLKSAGKFEKLGANFDYCDQQKRTALHYAVQYHSIELVSWLCARGSTPTSADINGNYPLTEATEKGDYAVVELFVMQFPATRQQKNKAGLTAFQIAEKKNLKRIAYVLKNGKSAPDSLDDQNSKPKGPRHSQEVLINAAKNGHLTVVNEFIEDEYESFYEKREICLQMIKAARTTKQAEVVSVLEDCYKKLMKSQQSSAADASKGNFVRLSQYYTNILHGFLTGLGQIIADSPVVLDPSDPQTHVDLFSHLTAKRKEHTDEIHQVSSDQDAERLSEKDMATNEEKLKKLEEELKKLEEEKEKAEKGIRDISTQLQDELSLTPIEREDLFKQREEHRKQVAAFESSILLCQLQQEAISNRQKTVKYIRKNKNMYLFFRTVENLLQALFHGVLAARSGILARNKGDGGAISLIPFSEVITGAVKAAIGSIASKMDEKKQKKEFYNISTLGNIEELGRIASDTASLLTLYYKDQIQSIDRTSKIKGSNIFNDKIRWINDTIIEGRPEEQEKLVVVIVAEYITAWVIKILREKTKLNLEEPLPQQLWYSVAKNNFLDQTNKAKMTDILGTTAGRQEIPLERSTIDGQVNKVRVQLRHLVGCASVVTDGGHIYQYEDPDDSSNRDLADLTLFGYVYVSPFLSKDQSYDDIISQRKLNKFIQDIDGRIRKSFEGIKEYVETFRFQHDRDRRSVLTVEMTRQIATVLREQKTFVDSKEVQRILKESRQAMKIEFDALREDMQEKISKQQITIEAAKERLERDVTQAKAVLRKESDKHYHEALEKMNERIKQLEKALENQLMERFNTLETQLKSEHTIMRKIVEDARSDANQALQQLNQATETCEQFTERTEQACAHVTQLIESSQQREQEFQIIMADCEAKVEQTIADQRQYCETSIDAVRTKSLQDIERSKAAAEQVAIEMKAMGQEMKAANKVVADIRNEVQREREERKKERETTATEVKNMTKHSERLLQESKEAIKYAKQSTDQSQATLKELEEMRRILTRELDRLERLSRK